jgi:DNA-directed RNA polymerase subunit omega
MARITVEDCLEKIDSRYDLVLLAKERTSQLNAGNPSLVPQDNDKNTVIALREIGEGKISIKTLEDSAIGKLMKQQKETTEIEESDDESEDSFDKLYKGEISKSGVAVLPSKRTRRIPEKVNLTYKISDDDSDVKKEKSKLQSETELLSTDKES